MSKKHKKLSSNQFVQKTSTGLSHESEYKIIKNDLIRVVILNLVYFAAIVGLYIANRQSQFLDNWLLKVFKF